MTERARREERRLRKIFGRALWLAAAAPAGVLIPFACGDAALPTLQSGTQTTGATTGGATTGASTTGGSTTGGGDVDGGDADVVVDKCAPVNYDPVPADDCGAYVKLPCGLPPGVSPTAGGGCFLLLKDCAQICPTLIFNCHATPESCDGGSITPMDDGTINIDCAICNGGVGRVPAGLAGARIPRRSAIGDYFAAAAHLEAASVHSFRRLHGELAAHGASASLLRAVRRAERDEVRHARVTGRLARRFGGSPARPRVAALRTRALDIVAIENAVEGCVRETFGALIASFQAANAQDPEIARAMEGIARDETRHAALSWAISRWASRRLDAEARARLDAKCRDAVDSLRRAEVPERDPDLVARAGLPSAAQEKALLDTLDESLWQIAPRQS